MMSVPFIYPRVGGNPNRNISKDAIRRNWYCNVTSFFAWPVLDCS